MEDLLGFVGKTICSGTYASSGEDFLVIPFTNQTWFS